MKKNNINATDCKKKEKKFMLTVDYPINQRVQRTW